MQHKFYKTTNATFIFINATIKQTGFFLRGERTRSSASLRQRRRFGRRAGTTRWRPRGEKGANRDKQRHQPAPGI